MEGFYGFLQSVAELLPLIGLLALGLLAASLLIIWLAKLLELRRILRQQYIFLELTPPAQAAKEPRATQGLFSVVHGLSSARPTKDKVLRRKIVLAPEVVATRKDGIRYIARVPQVEASTFQRDITSYLPDMRVKQVNDYVINRSVKGKVIEFKQSGHFAFPLNMQEVLEQHDPMGYLTSAMTKLADDEQIAFQIVLSPTRSREAENISSKILSNEDLLSYLTSRKVPGFSGVLSGINSLLFGILDGIGSATHSSSGRSYRSTSRYDQLASQKQQVAMKLRPARILSTFEQELVESIQHKVRQPLFQVSIRAYVTVNSKSDEKQRIKGLRASLASFSVPKYQSLQAKYNFPSWLKGRYRQFAFQHRLPSLFQRNACLLSASEVADLYHFPYAGTTQTENIVKSLSRTLPAPVSLKNGTAFDVVIGANHHHGTVTPIGLTEKERERHVYIIGGTGNGKTTMLLYAIQQDIANGKGLAVVDPHGDLAETILRHVPEDRIKDVIYFNPNDLARPIGVNLLEVSEDLTGDDLLDEKDRITESVVSIFRKIFSDEDDGGHRIEYVLRNAIQTALTQKDATLFTIYDLLNDPDYRKRVIATLDDKNLKNFWRNEFGKAGGMQRVKMAAGITAKIGRFLFSASAKRILEQPKSTINFDDIINEGKILICNFSKGRLGEDTSELFGITVLAKLQLASLRRERLKQAERRPFYLYVDEFQNFATMSFVQMLSESRKYKLFLLMAEQSTSQQEDRRMVGIILANVGTVVCFRTGNPADEQAVLAMFASSIETGEIANLAAFNYFVRSAAIHSQEPFSGETVLLEDEGSERIAKRIIEHSRTAFGIDYKKSQIKAKAKPKPATKNPTEVKPKESKTKRDLPGQQPDPEQK